MALANNLRTTLNLGFNFHDYAYINHVQSATQWGPISTTWASGNTFMESIGPDGHPNVSILSTDNRTYGGGIRIPASWQYGDGADEFYVLRWKGDGQVRLSLSLGSWTLQAGLSSNAEVVSSDTWRSTSAADKTVETYVVVKFTGPAQVFSIIVQATDKNNAGAFLNTLAFYRLDDEADYLAGKVFRTPYKQSIVDFNPGILRFMDWTGGNNPYQTHFDTRTLPNYPAWGNGGTGTKSNFIASPAYGGASFVDAPGTANQWTLAASAGTSGNTKTTPVSDLHGELVVCRMDTAAVRPGVKTVTGITSASTGVVTTSAAHTFNDGDIVAHLCAYTDKTGTLTNGSNVITGTTNSGIVAGMRVDHKNIPVGTIVISTTSTTITLSANATASVTNTAIALQAMPKLHQFPCRVANSTSTTYELHDLNDNPIDTTSMGTFGGTVTVEQFTTLNVGGRGPKPIVFPSVSVYAARYGVGYISAGDIKSFVYDKTISLQSDGAGNPIYGVWIFNNSGTPNGHNGGTPLEICTALTNEVNEMSSQPIDMWVCIPHIGTSSMDPDYTSARNYGVNAANVILNGVTIDGRAWSGLVSGAKLFLEYSNETWNGPNDNFSQTGYCSLRGYFLWNGQSGRADVSSMHALRSTVAMQDIAASEYYDADRIKFVMSGQGTQGLNERNTIRMDGNDFIKSHPSYPAAGLGCMAYHDHFSFAGYWVPNSTWTTNNLATQIAAWASHIGDAESQEADCEAYLLGYTTFASGGNETMDRYGDTLLPAYGAKMATYGKTAIMYEGGWDTAIAPITGGNRSGTTIIYTEGVFDGSTTSVTGVVASYVSAVAAALASGPVFIYGYGIPPDTTVTEASGTTLTLSNATTVAMTWGQFQCFNAQNAFLLACKRSWYYAQSVRKFMNKFGTNSEHPAEYIQLDLRFGQTSPSAYGFGATEWGDMFFNWENMSLRNNGKRQIRVRT